MFIVGQSGSSTHDIPRTQVHHALTKETAVFLGLLNLCFQLMRDQTDDTFFYPTIRLLVAHGLIDLSIYSPRNGRIHEHDERNGFVGMPLSTPICILSNLKNAVQALGLTSINTREKWAFRIKKCLENIDSQLRRYIF